MLELFVFGSSLAIASHNVIATAANRRADQRSVLLLSSSASTALILCAALASSSSFTTVDLLWGVAAGLFGGAAIPIAYRSMSLGPVAVAVPVTVIASSATLVLVGILRDGIDSQATVGLLLCLLAVFVSTRGRKQRGSPMRTSALALVAGAGFGGFSLCLSYVSPASGLWPLVAARAIVVVLAIALAAFRIPETQKELRTPGVPLAGLVGGAFDALANLLLFAALRTGELVTIGIVSSTAPIMGGLLAWRFLAEPLQRHHVLGLTMTVFGLVLLAL